MMHVSHMRKIGWVAVLLICTALYAMLHLTVNSVKSEVRLAERKIVSLKQDKFRLETEFLTRSNQRQLAEWNEVDFGYQAPNASQFIENERALAFLGTPRGVDAPAPIRLAVAPREPVEESPFAGMVSPITGEAIAAEVSENAPVQVAVGDDMAEEFRRTAASELSGRLRRTGMRVALSASASGGE